MSESSQDSEESGEWIYRVVSEDAEYYFNVPLDLEVQVERYGDKWRVSLKKQVDDVWVDVESPKEAENRGEAQAHVRNYVRNYDEVLEDSVVN